MEGYPIVSRQFDVTDVSEIEFWAGQPSRLHDRFSYRLEDGKWKAKRLAP